MLLLRMSETILLTFARVMFAFFKKKSSPFAQFLNHNSVTKIAYIDI